MNVKTKILLGIAVFLIVTVIMVAIMYIQQYTIVQESELLYEQFNSIPRDSVSAILYRFEVDPEDTNFWREHKIERVSFQLTSSDPYEIFNEEKCIAEFSQRSYPSAQNKEGKQIAWCSLRSAGSGYGNCECYYAIKK